MDANAQFRPRGCRSRSDPTSLRQRSSGGRSEERSEPMRRSGQWQRSRLALVNERQRDDRGGAEKGRSTRAYAFTGAALAAIHVVSGASFICRRSMVDSRVFRARTFDLRRVFLRLQGHRQVMRHCVRTRADEHSRQHEQNHRPDPEGGTRHGPSVTGRVATDQGERRGPRSPYSKSTSTSPSLT